jgi:hypothetical protein
LQSSLRLVAPPLLLPLKDLKDKDVKAVIAAAQKAV